MRPITRYYDSQNEYTSPLSGSPYYRNSGIIYAVDRCGSKYAVSRVDFERYDDQNFQYVFTPEWSVIDTLPSSIFQGIPGLDMSMRLERYYRVNMTPYFISDRTPSESREDLWELLDAVGLDYYDRFEADQPINMSNWHTPRPTPEEKAAEAAGRMTDDLPEREGFQRMQKNEKKENG